MRMDEKERTELTRSAAPAEQLSLAVLEQLDDQAIISEANAVIEDSPLPLAYQFQCEGRTIQGLTFRGVEVVTREMAKQGEVLRVIGSPRFDFVDVPVSEEKIEKYLQCSISAQRFAVGKDGTEVALDTALGVKAEPVLTEARNGSLIFNRYIFERTASKAMRNAFAKLMRPDIAGKVLAEAIRAGSVAGDAKLAARGRPAPGPASKLEPAKDRDGQWLSAMATARDRLGPEVFLKILGSHGFENAEQVAKSEARGRILEEMRAAAKRSSSLDFANGKS